MAPSNSRGSYQPHVEEEYTDYSCSTAIERLARDVETCLRGWHVDRGSDRHVSLSAATKEVSSAMMNASSNSNNMNGSMNNNMNLNNSFSDNVSVHSTGSTSSNMSTAHLSNLIRSNPITWNLNLRRSGGGGRTSLTLDLELALWDEPVGATTTVGGVGGGAASQPDPMNGMMINANNNNSFTSFLLQQNGGHASIPPPSVSSNSATNFHTDTEPLARSLQRSTAVETDIDITMDTLIVPTSFNNFSTLFGIGQYITLSPIQSHSQQAMPQELIDYLLENNGGGPSILNRHDDVTTSRYILGSILCSWLQTSLNIATSNVQCCIPVIGIWGCYQPLSGYQRHTLVLTDENDEDDDEEEAIRESNIDTPRHKNIKSNNNDDNGGTTPSSILKKSSKFTATSRSSSMDGGDDENTDNDQTEIMYVWKRVGIPTHFRRPSIIGGGASNSNNNNSSSSQKIRKSSSTMSVSSTNNSISSSAISTNPNANFYTTSSLTSPTKKFTNALLVLPNWSHSIMNDTSLIIPNVSRKFRQQASDFSYYRHSQSGSSLGSNISENGASAGAGDGSYYSSNHPASVNSGFWNMKFRPPLITGSVIVPSTITNPAVHATFWCSITTYSTGNSYDYDETAAANHNNVGGADVFEDAVSVQSLATNDTGNSGRGGGRRNKKNATQPTSHGMIMNTKYSRLTEWSNVLLQHCNASDRTVVLNSAKHIYGWYRPGHYHPDLVNLIGNGGSGSRNVGGGSSSSGGLTSTIFNALTRGRGRGGRHRRGRASRSTATSSLSKLDTLLAMTEWRSMSMPPDGTDGDANTTTVTGDFGNIVSIYPYASSSPPSYSDQDAADDEKKTPDQAEANDSMDDMLAKAIANTIDLTNDGDEEGKGERDDDDFDNFPSEEDEFEMYRLECRNFVMKALSGAWGNASTQRGAPTMENELPGFYWTWGPLEDPVSNVHVTCTWTGRKTTVGGTSNVSNIGTGYNTTLLNASPTNIIIEPLVTFPLRIRSRAAGSGRQTMSTSDWREIEDSVESSILNPLMINEKLAASASIMNCGITVSFDREIPITTLAAQQKCLLASLIRAATLPRETMLHHLTDRQLVELWDDDAGTVVATKFAQRANVGRTTQALVRAMDWSSSIGDIIDPIDAEAIIHNVMNGSLTASIPISPESSFSSPDIYSPFRKTAPYGRLLSVLFAYMSQTRTLSSMASIWNIFCQELRRRWENRESLPNMQYVPGLDPHPLELYEQRCFSTIGLKANFAAFLYCSEPDPDDYHCLIGQKLQVFNLGIENLVATEIAEHEAMERFLLGGEIPLSAQSKQANVVRMNQDDDNDPYVANPSGGFERVPSTLDMLPPSVEATSATSVSGGGGLPAVNVSDAASRDETRQRKWPKARDMPIPTNRSTGDIANYSNDEFDNYGSGMNYGPPTINTDLEFWVMDEPGYGPKMDQARPLDYAEVAHDSDEFGAGLLAPTTNLDQEIGELDFSQLTGKKESSKTKIKVREYDDDGQEIKSGVVSGVRRKFQRRRSSMGTSSVMSGSTGGGGSDTASRGSFGGGRPKREKKKGAPAPEPKTIVVEGLPDATGTSGGEGMAWEGMIAGGSGGSVATSCSQSQAYFDAAEAGSIFSMKNGFVNLDTVINVDELQSRPGARCPVHGISIAGHNGDQLYAPYLQRPYPLTDDIVLERRMMLSQPSSTDDKDTKSSKKSKKKRHKQQNAKGSLQFRIEVSQRLQKPKLLSDMKAFKAANPNAVFEDFTKWYGNPGSPLDDYNNDDIMNYDPDGDNDNGPTVSRNSLSKDVKELSAAKKLDKASEAMKVLIATRDFWSETWEEACDDPAPASEQSPLFDVSSTVEMTLDYLERMHPACLVNQVLAVNLSAAYFTLISSANDTLHIGAVEASLEKLRKRVDRALFLLARDATHGSKSIVPSGDDIGNNESSSAITDQASAQAFASEQTLSACEDACNTLSESETLVARSMSLLHKFPKQYDLINQLLKVPDGSIVTLSDIDGRRRIFNAICRQQKGGQFSMLSDTTSGSTLPIPLLREYTLRNLDDSSPCQLSVRFGDKGSYIDSPIDEVETGGEVEANQDEGAILLALTKSFQD